MIPNQPVYVMGKTQRTFSPCGKCQIPVKRGRKYVIDPVNTSVIYHAECFKQKFKVKN